MCPERNPICHIFNNSSRILTLRRKVNNRGSLLVCSCYTKINWFFNDLWQILSTYQCLNPTELLELEAQPILRLHMEPSLTHCNVMTIEETVLWSRSGPQKGFIVNKSKWLPVPAFQHSLHSYSSQLAQFSCSVVSDFLHPCGLQHARLPCPSPTPRGCSNSCLLSRWCHPTISSSVVPFSSCLQSFPA